MNAEMLWIDLETTGLDAIEDIPLELGLMVTNKEGDEIAKAKWLIWEDTVDWRIKMGRGASHSVVGPMHEDSGLWDDLLKHRSEPPRVISRAQVDTDACRWLESIGAEAFTLPMAGSSIGSLDRPFVIQHFPNLNQFFHYRNIDVSSLKELCKMHNPELYEKLPTVAKNRNSHRVLEDIEDSIAEYKFYLENFLWT